MFSVAEVKSFVSEMSNKHWKFVNPHVAIALFLRSVIFPNKVLMSSKKEGTKLGS